MKQQNHRIVTLKHLLIRQEKQIGLKFYPDKMAQTIVKGLPEVKWSKEFGMAYLKNNPKNLTLIFEYFNGIAWVNCAHFFPNRKARTNNSPVTINNFSQRKLPENYRKYPEVKRLHWSCLSLK